MQKSEILETVKEYRKIEMESDTSLVYEKEGFKALYAVIPNSSVLCINISNRIPGTSTDYVYVLNDINKRTPIGCHLIEATAKNEAIYTYRLNFSIYDIKDKSEMETLINSAEEFANMGKTIVENFISILGQRRTIKII